MKLFLGESSGVCYTSGSEKEYSINKPTKSKKSVNFHDDSIEQARESLRKLEDIYLKQQDNPVCD